RPAGGGDIILMHLDQDGRILYATYLGGSRFDQARAIALDPVGNIYITGPTQSADFPTTAGAFDRPCGIGGSCRNTEPNDQLIYDDAFVTKLDPTGRSIVYSTYLGGRLYDDAYGIAVDDAGVAHVTGVTRAHGFPLPAGSACETESTGGAF